MYIDILNYGCGSVSQTFGVLVSGCIYTHVNGKLEYIRLNIHVYVDNQLMVEGILILRQSSIFGCLLWFFKFFQLKVVDLLWS
jgi:hypothetical protein